MPAQAPCSQGFASLPKLNFMASISHLYGVKIRVQPTPLFTIVKLAVKVSSLPRGFLVTQQTLLFFLAVGHCCIRAMPAPAFANIAAKARNKALVWDLRCCAAPAPQLRVTRVGGLNSPKSS